MGLDQKELCLFSQAAAEVLINAGQAESEDRCNRFLINVINYTRV